MIDRTPKQKGLAPDGACRRAVRRSVGSYGLFIITGDLSFVTSIQGSGLRLRSSEFILWPLETTNRSVRPAAKHFLLLRVIPGLDDLALDKLATPILQVIIVITFVYRNLPRIAFHKATAMMLHSRNPVAARAAAKQAPRSAPGVPLSRAISCRAVPAQSKEEALRQLEQFAAANAQNIAAAEQRLRAGARKAVVPAASNSAEVQTAVQVRGSAPAAQTAAGATRTPVSIIIVIASLCTIASLPATSALSAEVLHAHAQLHVHTCMHPIRAHPHALHARMHTWTRLASSVFAVLMRSAANGALTPAGPGFSGRGAHTCFHAMQTPYLFGSSSRCTVQRFSRRGAAVVVCRASRKLSC